MFYGFKMLLSVALNYGNEGDIAGGGEVLSGLVDDGHRIGQRSSRDFQTVAKGLSF